MGRTGVRHGVGSATHTMPKTSVGGCPSVASQIRRSPSDALLPHRAARLKGNFTSSFPGLRTPQKSLLESSGRVQFRLETVRGHRHEREGRGPSECLQRLEIQVLNRGFRIHPANPLKFAVESEKSPQLSDHAMNEAAPRQVQRPYGTLRLPQWTPRHRGSAPPLPFADLPSNKGIR